MSQGASTVELMVRLVFSLGLILGILGLIAKYSKKSGGKFKLPGMGRNNDAAIKVLERQSLGKAASVAALQVGERTMLVGVTEHGVTMLADVSDDLALPAEPVTAAVAATETTISAESPREAKWTLPLDSTLALAPATASGSGRSPRMSFVQAVRELTVRK